MSDKQLLSETLAKSEIKIAPRTFKRNSIQLKKFLSNERNFVICKPRKSFGGHGIVVTNLKEKIPKNYVIQEYETDVLLYKGHRFENRLFVLVTSVNPLIVYVHPDGFARFQKAKFTGVDLKSVFSNIQAPMVDQYGVDQRKWITDSGFRANISSAALMHLFDFESKEFDF